VDAPGPTGLAALIVALLATGLMTLGAATASAAETGPAGAAFYEPPEKLPKGHGKLIWKRGAGKVVGLEGAAYTSKVLYTSKSPSASESPSPVPSASRRARPRGAAGR
jgi:hypothetical protein